MKYVLPAIIGAYALIGITAPAFAQMQCGPKAAILAELQNRFKEWPIFEGKGKSAKFIVTRPDEGGWTILRIEGEVACLVADGKSSAMDRGV